MKFIAAGKHYESLSQLTTLGTKEYRCKDAQCYWIGREKDIYGREVLHVSERFPIFDSYDALYDHRYFHWYYIRHYQRKGFRRVPRLTLVYAEDGRDLVEVTEGITEGGSKLITCALKCEGWM